MAGSAIVAPGGHDALVDVFVASRAGARRSAEQLRHAAEASTQVILPNRARVARLAIRGRVCSLEREARPRFVFEVLGGVVGEVGGIVAG